MLSFRDGQPDAFLIKFAVNFEVNYESIETCLFLPTIPADSVKDITSSYHTHIRRKLSKPEQCMIYYQAKHHPSTEQGVTTLTGTRFSLGAPVLQLHSNCSLGSFVLKLFLYPT